MSISLHQDFVSCNEACISWTISPYSISQNSIPILVLSDINQSGVNTFSTIKHFIRPNEIFQGTHTFTGLNAGEYTVEILIISGNNSESSSPLSITVYQVDTPVFQNTISGNQKFTITLEQPICDMTDGRVTFILYGQSFLQGNTQNTFSGIINSVFSYASDNTYIIDSSEIQNNSEYEISCFYTNSVNISGLLSPAQLKRPTNAPNQSTILEAIYNASLRTLTVTHNLPSNASDYDLIDLRATITDISTNNVTYYYSSENSALLDPAPEVADHVVFNMNNKNLLPVDTEFTITLSAKNEVNLWGPEESAAIKCVYTNDFSAVPLSVSDLTFSVGLESITIADNNTYVKNPVYDIIYTASVYNSNDTGNIIGSAIETKTQTNDMNFVFSDLVTGNLYKVIFNLYYLYTFSDNTTVAIEQNTMDTCYKHFIPHDIAEQLTVSATPSDESVLVNWLDITQNELNGFILDHYEVSHDNTNWINKNLLLSHNFTGLTNGTSLTFYVRAVSNSGTTLYLSGETKYGQTASITSIPYGTPSNLTKVSQLPGDEKCTIVWTIPQLPYNGGLFDKFEASVNSGSYVTIETSFANDQYTYEFTGLTNLVSNSILICLVNKNQPNLNNVDTIKRSDSLSIVTTPFSLPAAPSSFQAAPNTMSVLLSWLAVTPASIIDNSVKYELHYKLQSNSDFTVVSNIATNSYNVTNLISNSMYEFKIRSTIHNTEVDSTFYSEFTSILSSRTFVYLNAPNMVLEAGNNTIIAKLTPNVNNFFQTKFKYHATVSNADGSNSSTLTLSDVTNSNQQTITFTVLGDNSGLVNLSEYKVEARYEMLNTDNNQYYSSNTVDNVIRPFNSNLVPVLSSISGNTVVDLSWDISAFDGYTITHYELSNNNVSWSTVENVTQMSSNILKTVTGLSNGQLYDFYVRVIYEVNNETKTSNASNKVTNIPFTNASAPTNLSSVPDSTQITFYWEAPTNLNGLELDHFDVKIDNGSWLNVGTDNSHVFSNLVNGTLYTMYVRPVTLNVLEGNVYVYGASASNSNIPYTTSSAPIFVSCVEGNQQLTLTWSQPSGLGGLLLASYDVKIGNGSWVNVGTDTSYVFSGLTNGQGYSLSVRSNTNHPIIGTINGATYTSSNFYPYTTPSAPIFVSCVEGNQQLTLTWSQPSGLGGLSLDHYEVRTNSNSWINAGLNLSRIITGLTNGQTHTVSIKSVVTHPNLGLIDGATYTSISTFVPNGGAIAPTFHSSATLSRHSDGNPTALKISINLLPGTRVGDTWVETIGPNTGGLPVSHYEYSLDTITWTRMVNTVNDGNYSVTTISAGYYPSDGIFFPANQLGSTKTVYARAVCTHPNLGLMPGTSFSRNALVYVTPTAPIFNTIVAGDQSLTITWQAMLPYVSGLPNVNGCLNGLPLVKYQVAVNYYGNGTNWIDVNSSTTSYTFSGLTNGTSLAPLVRAIANDEYKNVSGPGIDTLVYGSWATSSANTPYKPASAPTLNTILQQDQQLTLTWNAPALGGLSFVRYEMSSNGGSTWTSSVGNANYTYSATTPSFVFTSLTNGDSYNLAVRTITSHPVLGEIAGQTFTSASYVPYKVVAAPEITVTHGDRQILLQWSTPDLGGLPLAAFQLSYNGTTWSDLISQTGLVFVTNNMNSSVTFTGLTNGTNYTYYFRSKTAHPNLGNINSLSTNVSSTPFVKPGVVSNVVASAINGSLNFSFTAPADLNNNAITQNYEYSIDEGVNWNALYQLTSLTTSIGNDMFSLKIRAYIINPNDNTTRVNSDIYTLNNLQNVDIITPQNLSSSFGNGTVSLFWDAVNAQGISYQVIRYFENGSTSKVLTNNNTYTFTGLTNGTMYRFGVALYTSGTAGPVSNITVTPMIAPIINSVTKSGDNLIVNIDFGGSSNVNIVLTSSAVETINGKDYIPVEGGQETISVNSSSNPTIFSGMTNKTRFDIVVSNTVGNTNGTYVI